jgi:hypothetical protein
VASMECEASNCIRDDCGHESEEDSSDEAWACLGANFQQCIGDASSLATWNDAAMAESEAPRAAYDAIRGGFICPCVAKLMPAKKGCSAVERARQDVEFRGYCGDPYDMYKRRFCSGQGEKKGVEGHPVRHRSSCF